MKLINHVEPIMQLLNSPHVGQFLEFEEGGNISKSDIEHFVLVHLSHPGELDNLLDVKKKAKKKAVVEEEEDVSEEDVVNMSEAETLQLIRRIRKINCPSINVLKDNGWFLCPIYVGVTELRPLICKKLPAKKGYKLVILDASIGNIEGLFTKDNLKEWELNSMRKLDMHFDNSGLGFKSMSVFIHKKDDIFTKRMRNAVNRLETTQRTRIKLGNILVDEVISIVGQEAYINNKQNLAKSNKSKSSVTEYDTNDVKIIKYIEKAYKRINKTAEKMDVKTPIRRHKSFDAVIEQIIAEEKLEHQDRANAWLKSINDGVANLEAWKNASNGNTGMPTLEYAMSVVRNEIDESQKGDEAIDIQKLAQEWIDNVKVGINKLKDWKESYKQNLIDEGEDEETISVPDMPTMEDALAETKQLGVHDYIESFLTYVNVQNYMQYVKSEKDAELVVNELVHESYLWEYIEGIKGCGEITAAYILSDIDFRSTVHASSVVRYLGLDNITTVPDREGKPVSEEQLPLIIRFLFHNYNLIRTREDNSDQDDIGVLPPISEDTFYRYASEMVEDWSEYKAIEKVIKTKGVNKMDPHKILELDTNFAELVQKVWEHCDIIEYRNQRGEMIPTIKKHARSKKDSVVTTFLDKNGNISTKKSLGYNTKLKARIIEIMFGSMMKAKNEFYYGELYLGFRERKVNEYLAQGKDPEIHKNHIHMQARRYAVQIFIENLWMWVRQKKGWPTNGGTYYEAKLKGTHGHGLAMNSPLN